MSEPWIQFKNWSFRYTNSYTPALVDINLTLYHGEKVLVLGSNASGKTTFIRALRDQLGDGDYTGETMGEMIRQKRHVTTIDGKQMVSAVNKVDKDETEDINQLDWSRLGNREYIETNYDFLSTGEQDILKFMTSVDTDQSVFIFDEPLANLSPQTAQVLIDLLDDFSQATNASIVLAGYRLEQTMYRPIDRVIVLNEGRVVFDGNVEALLKRDILHTFSIREPLYISALRYSGYPLNQVGNIANVKHIYGPRLKETIEKWLLSVPNFRYPKATEELLCFEKLSFKYPNQMEKTLKNLNVRFNKGEIISIVGGNGAGKTTLSRILSGGLKPTSGKVYYQDEQVSEANLDAIHRKIAFIPHNQWECLKSETVREQLLDSANNLGLSPAVLEERMNNSLTALGLHYALDFPIKQLSYGQQKRVLLAQALMSEAEVLIIDEPTEGQDYYHYNELMQYIYTICHQYGLLVMVNSHDIDLALEFTQRTIVLNKGRIIADTTPINVATDPYLIRQSGLRETSLYTFAKQIRLVDPYHFIQKFINYHRAINQ